MRHIIIVQDATNCCWGAEGSALLAAMDRLGWDCVEQLESPARRAFCRVWHVTEPAGDDAYESLCRAVPPLPGYAPAPYDRTAHGDFIDREEVGGWLLAMPSWAWGRGMWVLELSTNFSA